MSVFDSEKKEKLQNKFKELKDLQLKLLSKKTYFEEAHKDALKTRRGLVKRLEDFSIVPENLDDEITERAKKVVVQFKNYQTILTESAEKFDVIEKTLRDEEPEEVE